MASESTVVPFITPDIKTQADFSGHANKVVTYGAGGPVLATTAGSGALFVLANKPTSGMAFSLVAAPNMAKCYADAATVRGMFAAVSATRSGYVANVGSAYGVGFLGVCLTAVASGSLVDVLLK